MKQQTWFISGGCGFIGRNLLRSLLLKENVGVRIFDNCSVGSRKDLAKITSFYECEAHAPQPKPGEVQLVEGDITDSACVSQSMCSDAIVVHLAANTGVPFSVENPDKDFHANVLGTFTLLEAARQSKAQRFIFASSGAPTGNCVPPVSENVVPRPISPYGASKLTGEAYCSAYFHSFGLETVALRFSNVYGPLSKHKSSVVAKFINMALQGKPWKIYGDGKQTRDFLYIDDLVAAIHAASIRPSVGGEIFQIASGEETSLQELSALLSIALKNHNVTIPDIEYERARVGDIVRNFAAITKSKKYLQWQCKTELLTGLEATVDWFVKTYR